jgi:methylenetetrahydrofolate dehydrogenase (NADP+)/methenyltetrahydrofolate cyclohydrolase
MTAELIDGKAFSDRVAGFVADQARAFTQALGRPPGLAVVLVGDNPASQVYVRNKGLRATACGLHSAQYDLPATVAEVDLLDLIDQLNRDPAIDGILVQLPLPARIDASRVLQAIDPAKDVDGFHPINVGLLGAGARDKALVPCTPAGCLLLVGAVLGGDLSGLEAVVVGRSNIVGKAVAQLLVQH